MVMQVLSLLMIVTVAGFLAEWSLRRYGMNKERKFAAVMMIIGGLIILRPPWSLQFYFATFSIGLAGAMLLMPILRTRR
jgi:hypothetical protein